MRVEVLRREPSSEKLEERDQLLGVQITAQSRFATVRPELKTDSLGSLNLGLGSVRTHRRRPRHDLTRLAETDIGRILLVAFAYCERSGLEKSSFPIQPHFPNQVR